MPDLQTRPEGPGINPPPDPWIPPEAMVAQGASIATGATGAALLIGDQPSGQSLLMLPDPAAIFGRVGHVLGFQFDLRDVWTWGLVLIVVSVLLNIYSYVVRYRFAKWVKPLWDAQLKDIEQKLARADAFQQQTSTPQAKAQGFVGGDA